MIILLSVELVLNAANLALIAFSRYRGACQDGQVFALVVMAVAASEVVVGLGAGGGDVAAAGRARRRPPDRASGTRRHAMRNTRPGSAC